MFQFKAQNCFYFEPYKNVSGFEVFQFIFQITDLRRFKNSKKKKSLK